MTIKHDIRVAYRIDSYTRATAVGAVQPFLLQFLLLHACDRSYAVSYQPKFHCFSSHYRVSIGIYIIIYLFINNIIIPILIFPDIFAAIFVPFFVLFHTSCVGSIYPAGIVKIWFAMFAK